MGSMWSNEPTPGVLVATRGDQSDEGCLLKGLTGLKPP